MKFLVLGAGAIGGYFGGRLVESGADVTFLVRPNRRTQLERDGLRIESALGNVSRPVRTALAGSVASHYDVVILTCKAYDLQSSIDSPRDANTWEASIRERTSTSRIRGVE